MRCVIAAALIVPPGVAQIPPACALPRAPVATLPVTIPIDVHNNHVFVKVCAGDRSLNFVVAIDYVIQELRLYDARTFRYEGPGASIPLTFIEGQPHVIAEVRLAGQRPHGDRRRIGRRAGAHQTVRRGETALVQRFAAGPSRGRWPGNGHRAGRDAQARGVEIVRPVTSLFGPSAGVFSGNRAWIGFTVVLDYANQRMILEPHAGTSDPSKPTCRA